MVPYPLQRTRLNNNMHMHCDPMQDKRTPLLIGAGQGEEGLAVCQMLLEMGANGDAATVKGQRAADLLPELQIFVEKYQVLHSKSSNTVAS